MANRNAPFDGPCHVCRRAEAETATKVIFKVLDDRQIITSERSNLVVLQQLLFGRHWQREQEVWEVTIFPFMLCSGCHRKFAWWRFGRFMMKLASWVPLVGFVAGSSYASSSGNVLGGIFLGFAALYALFYKIMKVRQPKKIDQSLIRKWLGKIPWLSEAFGAAGESSLSLGRAVPIERYHVIAARAGHKKS